MQPNTFIADHYNRLTDRFRPATVARHEVRWMAACYTRWEDVQRVAYLATVQPRRKEHDPIWPSNNLAPVGPDLARGKRGDGVIDWCGGERGTR